MSPSIFRITSLSENEIHFYQTEGYLYIPGILSSATAANMRQEIIDIMVALGVSTEQLANAQETSDKLRQSPKYLKHGLVDQLVNSPILKNLAGELMGGPSTLHSPFTAVKSGGGGGEFHFHQDNQYTQFDGPGINFWFALNEMAPENGCLRVAPRSHLQGTYEGVSSGDGDHHLTISIAPKEFLPIRMMPGDCIAFSRLTVHGSGPNHTHEARVAYAVQFHRDDVRATWDGQPPRLLTEYPRLDNKGPVDKIVP
ncbi:MAG: phytanoyl-CoA dioxygenase family protein [Anaerolineae bacterium]|nr:phytanoyl-CoA dioxygenase family protein [Anaerolineae bacterium]